VHEVAGERINTMEVKSAAFEPDARMPLEYTGEGEDCSPPLSWSGAPEGTREFAIICTDPDAPREKPWVHWVVCKISPVRSELPAGAQEGLIQGKNDFGRLGYGGPIPPRGHGVHHYHFRVYALDTQIAARPGITQDELLKGMAGHILAEGELIGTYEIA
jgi:Raf kinase inhibitor-like YbhB/YbcL family protein